MSSGLIVLIVWCLIVGAWVSGWFFGRAVRGKDYSRMADATRLIGDGRAKAENEACVRFLRDESARINAAEPGNVGAAWLESSARQLWRRWHTGEIFSDPNPPPPRVLPQDGTGLSHPRILPKGGSGTAPPKEPPPVPDGVIWP
jgi:hypothetical protein